MRIFDVLDFLIYPPCTPHPDTLDMFSAVSAGPGYRHRRPFLADTTVDAVREATGFDFQVAEPLKTMCPGMHAAVDVVERLCGERRDQKHPKAGPTHSETTCKKTSQFEFYARTNNKCELLHCMEIITCQIDCAVLRFFAISPGSLPIGARRH